MGIQKDHRLFPHPLMQRMVYPFFQFAWAWKKAQAEFPKGLSNSLKAVREYEREEFLGVERVCISLFRHL